MRTLSLKVDVDTLRGTREGVPRLATLFTQLRIPATFLFSLGPDHTGRALKRVFRPGFLRKVRRTSVASHYGLRTLLYGTLLPGPDIGRKCSAEMRAVAEQGFEVGVHCWDHVKWQDGVSGASPGWTREQLERAVAAFERVFGFRPRIHGAAGWQTNEHVRALQLELGFEIASDTRGRGPFVTARDGLLEMPTTLPTLDELIGLNGATAADAARAIVSLTRAAGPDHHVFTLHAEIEGGACLSTFQRMLTDWMDAGVEFRTLGAAADALDRAAIPTCRIETGRIDGRSGTLAVQAYI